MVDPGSSAPRRRRWAWALLTLVAVVLVLELSLRGAAIVSPGLGALLRGDTLQAVAVVDDPRLGLTLNPDHPEHDPSGFRNRPTQPRCDLVALGDSQTYGTNVALDQAWPQQLAGLAGRSTYNMGTPGHGPVQSLQLAAPALARQPRLLVATLYTGNDLYDAFRAVYGDRPVPAGVTRNADAALRAELEQQEAATPLDAAIGVAFAATFGAPNEAPPPPTGLRGWLGEHSRIYATLRAGWRAVRTPPPATPPPWPQVVERAAGHSGQLVVDGGDGLRTVLTPAYRRCALDLDDARLREGQRIALQALAALQDRARAAGSAVALLLIPTKELVYAEATAAADVRSPDLDALVADEQRLRAAVQAWAAEAKVVLIDALPALRTSLAQGQPPYPATPDGHPNPRGHRAIASAVHDAWLALDTGR